MSVVLLFRTATYVCSDLVNDFIQKSARRNISDALMFMPSDYVHRMLFSYKISTSRKLVYRADHKISGTLSVEYSSLTAISVASSTFTLELDFEHQVILFAHLSQK